MNACQLNWRLASQRLTSPELVVIKAPAFIVSRKRRIAQKQKTPAEQIRTGVFGNWLPELGSNQRPTD